MVTILTILHVCVCLFLIVIVLLQHGKGADMGATFGGASQTVFGTEGPLPLLNKITTAAAVVFMMTSIALAYLSSHQGTGSVMEQVAPPAATAPQPAKKKGPVTIPLPSSDSPGSGPAAFPGKEGGHQAP